MRLFIVCILAALVLHIPPAHAGEKMVIKASWYGRYEGSNARTADGTLFNQDDPTIAAHRSWPFGTRLMLTNKTNGRQLPVVVHDRGPFVKGRELDLTRAAARELGYEHQGLAMLLVEKMD